MSDKVEFASNLHIEDDLKARYDIFKSKTVLLIDDDFEVRRILGKILEKMNFAVFSAVNGISAIELYREYHEIVDFIVLDLSLPDVSGVEVFQEIRKQNQNQPIIFVASELEDQIAKLLHKNKVSYLSKPFSKEQIYEILMPLN